MKNESSWGGIVILLCVMAASLGALVFGFYSAKSAKGDTHPSDEPAVEVTDSVPEDVVIPDTSVVQAIPIVEEIPSPMPEQKAEPEQKTEPEQIIAPDLKWARVQGPVKMIYEKRTQISGGVKSSSNQTIRFDAKGKYIPSNPKLERVKHNNKGQIEQIVETRFTEYGTDKTAYSYKYDKNGYVKSEYEDYAPGEENIGVCVGLSHSYTLNENGWIVKDEYGGYLECSIHGTNTYTYSNFDKCGNWQKCVKKCKNVVCAYESTSTCTITRKITYWE